MAREKKDRTGETTVAKNGMKMTIIVYRNSHDMDVQFEDGSIRKGVRYRSFIKGEIRHPSEKDRTGETAVATNGMKMTIIAYRSWKDIDVQFEDGSIRKGVSYTSFKKGYVSHPSEKDRTGETTIANNGMKMTIIAYRNSYDIDVQFEDGAIKKGVRYSCFKRGIIRHPEAWEKLFLNKRIGETSVANNGMKMTIIAYRSATDIDVQFEDGFIKEGIDYAAFTTGAVQNPHFPMHGKGTYKTFQTQYAYTAPDGSVYFYCKCQECGWKKNLTARELIAMKHECIR